MFSRLFSVSVAKADVAGIYVIQNRNCLYSNPNPGFAMKNAEPDFRQLGCKECLESNPLAFEITMAFQPIVDLKNMKPFAYEALVRGGNGEGAVLAIATIKKKDRNGSRRTPAASVNGSPTNGAQLSSRLQRPYL